MRMINILVSSNKEGKLHEYTYVFFPERRSVEIRARILFYITETTKLTGCPYFQMFLFFRAVLNRYFMNLTAPWNALVKQ